MKNILFFLLVIFSLVDSEYIRACYFTSWARKRPSPADFYPENYVPDLCTHVFYYGGTVDEKYIAEAMYPADLFNGPNGGYFARIVKLKESQPGLNVILTFRYQDYNDVQRKKLLSNSGNRKRFIDSAVQLIDQYRFDGIDIEWEFYAPENKANFALFMKELKAAIGDRIVTLRAAPLKSVIDDVYDVPSLANSVDFVNVRAYGMYSNFNPGVQHHSPLHSRQNDSSDENAAFALNYWTEKGMPKGKLVMGIATYGRGWRLADPENTALGALKKDRPLQIYTQEWGIGAYYEICKLEGKEFWDDAMKVPYIVSGDLWYGYDDAESIKIKMEWIKENKFGGAFVGTLDFDDFNGICGEGKYPLTNVIKQYLEGFSCPSSKGTFVDSESCTRFYRCLHGRANQIYCPPRKEFDEKSLSCVPSYGCSEKRSV